MILIELILHSARTGRKRDLGRAVIFNDGTGTSSLGNYVIRVNRKRSKLIQREASVKRHPRLTESVWSLVRKALEAAGY